MGEESFTCTKCGNEWSRADDKYYYTTSLLERVLPALYSYPFCQHPSDDLVPPRSIPAPQPQEEPEEHYCPECKTALARERHLARREAAIDSFKPLIGAKVAKVGFQHDYGTRVDFLEFVDKGGKQWLLLLELDYEDGWLELWEKEEYEELQKKMAERESERQPLNLPTTIQFRKFGEADDRT